MFGNYTVVGDVHSTHKNLEKVRQLFDIVEALGKPTIFLGDLLDTKEVVRGKCLNLYFEYFQNSKLNHIVLVGNHDFFNLECEDHSLKPLKSLKNVLVIDKIQELNGFHFFPYGHNKDVIRQNLSAITNKKDKVVIGHFDISGFDYGTGYMCEDGLSVDDFKGFKQVISGHFHKYQILKNILYLGTPFSHSFGEANQNKYLATYKVDTNEINLIPTVFPRHMSIDLNLDKEDPHGVLQLFLQENKDNIKRVRLYGTEDQCASFDRSKYSEYSIKFEDKSESSKIYSTLDESSGNKSQFTEWAKTIRNLDPETTKIGLSILEALGAK